MGKFNFKAPAAKEPDQKTPSNTGNHNCSVFGCPRIATIKMGNWNCRYHNLRAGNMLDGITLVLKNHEREIDWYEKVLNMPYHEYNIFKGNAPTLMLHHADEELTAYRKRMAQYITGLLKHPETIKIPMTKTYVDFSSDFYN